LSILNNPPNEESSVALFVDWENMCDGIDTQEGITALRNQAEQFGTVVIARAYADWRDKRYQLSASALYQEGIEPVYVPVDTWDKYNADLKLTTDCIDYAHKHPSVETFVLATGDADFIHVVSTLRLLGKHIIAIAQSEKIAARLRNWVDVLVIYDQAEEVVIEIPPEPEPLIPRPANVIPAKTGRNGKLVDNINRTYRPRRPSGGRPGHSSSPSRSRSRNSGSRRSTTRSTPRPIAETLSTPNGAASSTMMPESARSGISSDENASKKKSAKKESGKRSKSKKKKLTSSEMTAQEVQKAIQPSEEDRFGEEWGHIWEMPESIQGQSVPAAIPAEIAVGSAKENDAALQLDLALNSLDMWDAVEDDGIFDEQKASSRGDDSKETDTIPSEVYRLLTGKISYSEGKRLNLGSIKSQLLQQFGHFDEREYGFSSFKAFIAKGAEKGHFEIIDESPHKQWLILPSTTAGPNVQAVQKSKTKADGNTENKAAENKTAESKAAKRAAALAQVFQDIQDFLKSQEKNMAYLSLIKGFLLEKYGKFSQSTYGFKKFSDMMQSGYKSGYFQLEQSGSEMAAIAK